MDVFGVSHKLRRAESPLPPETGIPSLAEHRSYTVPALEALLAIYLLAAYALVTGEGTNT